MVAARLEMLMMRPHLACRFGSIGAALCRRDLRSEHIPSLMGSARSLLKNGIDRLTGNNGLGLSRRQSHYLAPRSINKLLVWFVGNPLEPFIKELTLSAAERG
jgi:hypothetical protein